MGKTRGYTPYKINRNGEIENNDFALPKSLQAGSIDKLETNEDAFMFIQLSAPENLKKFEVYFKKTGTTTWKYGGIFAKTYFSVSEGVAPETAYTVRVKGIDENGNFVFFEPKDFTTQKVLFKTFRIRIGEEVVSSWNYQNINSKNFPAIKGGSITYDPNSNQLMLSGIELEGDIKYDISTADPEKKLTIRLFGDSNVKGCIYLSGSPLRITGTGKLQVEGIDASLLQRSALTIDGGCHIKSTQLIIAFKEEITINGATVEAPNIRSIGKINLLGGCKIVKPKNGVFDQYKQNKDYIFWTVYTSDSHLAQDIKIE